MNKLSKALLIATLLTITTVAYGYDKYLNFTGVWDRQNYSRSIVITHNGSNLTVNLPNSGNKYTPVNGKVEQSGDTFTMNGFAQVTEPYTKTKRIYVRPKEYFGDEPDFHEVTITCAKYNDYIINGEKIDRNTLLVRVFNVVVTEKCDDGTNTTLASSKTPGIWIRNT